MLRQRLEGRPLRSDVRRQKRRLTRGIVERPDRERNLDPGSIERLLEGDDRARSRPQHRLFLRCRPITNGEVNGTVAEFRSVGDDARFGTYAFECRDRPSCKLYRRTEVGRIGDSDDEIGASLRISRSDLNRAGKTIEFGMRTSSPV
jgi:hypothetical protein